MCLSQTNIVQFQPLKGALLALRPTMKLIDHEAYGTTHFFGSVIVMPNHTPKAYNVLLIHAIIKY